MLVWLSVVAMMASCRRDIPSTADAAPSNHKPLSRDILIFPEARKSDDPTVNEFVSRAMSVCGEGNYDEFRLLWSVRQDPLPRDQFEEGWQAVQEIHILALEKAMLAADAEQAVAKPQPVYALLAEVKLDPEHRAARDRPKREVVLMLVREQNAWRLADAPKPMREWIRQRVALVAPSDNGDSNP